MYRDIPGYKFKYRVNEEGTVEKLLPDGSWQQLRPYLGARTRACVKMRTKDNRKVSVPLVWLVADAFMHGRRPGLCIVHKNGCKLDCAVNNLQYMTRQECSRLSSGCKRKAVYKLDRDGNVLAVYKSVREAASKNYISETAVWNRCNRKLQDPFKLDGYDYRYKVEDYD